MIKANSGENLAEINVIGANAQFESILKRKPNKVTELGDGSLLVEVKNEEQSIRIRNVKKLDKTEVTTTEHESLKIKRTIRYKNEPRNSNEEICNILKDQKVVELHQVMGKVHGERLSTSIYLLTFESCVVLQEVTIGWALCPVREYIPKPRRFFKCHKFGHGRLTCRVETPVCVRCGLEDHGESCERTPKCINCGEEFPALSRDCFYYNL